MGVRVLRADENMRGIGSGGAVGAVGGTQTRDAALGGGNERGDRRGLYRSCADSPLCRRCAQEQVVQRVAFMVELRSHVLRRC